MDRAVSLLRLAVAVSEAEPWRRALAADNLGLVLDAQGRHEDAVASFHRALTLNPKQVMTWIHLASTLRALGRLKEARGRLGQALAMDPGNAAAQVELAALDVDMGRPGEARRRLDPLIAQGKLLPEALLERSRARRAVGDLAGARADLDRALEESPPGATRARVERALGALKPPSSP